VGDTHDTGMHAGKGKRPDRPGSTQESGTRKGRQVTARIGREVDLTLLKVTRTWRGSGTFEKGWPILIPSWLGGVFLLGCFGVGGVFVWGGLGVVWERDPFK